MDNKMKQNVKGRNLLPSVSEEQPFTDLPEGGQVERAAPYNPREAVIQTGEGFPRHYFENQIMAGIFGLGIYLGAIFVFAVLLVAGAI